MSSQCRWCLAGGHRSLQEVQGDHSPRPGSWLVLGRLVTSVASRDWGTASAATAHLTGLCLYQPEGVYMMNSLSLVLSGGRLWGVFISSFMESC